MEQVIDVTSETVDENEDLKVIEDLQEKVQSEINDANREAARNRRESEQRLKELKKELKKFRRYAKSPIHIVRQMDINAAMKEQQSQE